MNTSLFGFAFRFAICFAVLIGLFEASRGSAFERFVVEDGILAPTGRVMSAFSQSVRVDLPRRIIFKDAVSLHVTRGCEGVEMLLLLAAAIFAFPADARRRARGLLIGLLLCYALTIGRLIVLVFTLRDWPDSWEIMHGLIMPLLPVLVLAMYFLRWSTAAVAPIPAQRPLHEN
jgi:exosortase/archaeosortase family protein